MLHSPHKNVPEPNQHRLLSSKQTYHAVRADKMNGQVKLFGVLQKWKEIYKYKEISTSFRVKANVRE
jgi:hypothetical protein